MPRGMPLVQFYEPPALTSSQSTTGQSGIVCPPTQTLRLNPIIAAPGVHTGNFSLRSGHSPSDAIEIEDSDSEISSNDDTDAGLSSTSTPERPMTNSVDTSQQVSVLGDDMRA